MNDNDRANPRTVTLLLIFLASIGYVSFFRSYTEIGSTEANVKVGLVAAAIPLLTYGVLQFKNGIFTRPHPAFWRLVMGISLLYLMALVFFLMQSPADARHILTYLDPTHTGKPLPEKNYGENCAFTAHNVWNALDSFIIAHALGWFVKAVMLRDRTLLWIASVLFEILELTFRRMLINFNECWWDSLGLDILLCNWIGIETGLWFCRFMGAREFNWTSIRKIQTLRGKVRRSFGQFLPIHFDSFRWHVFESRWRFLHATGIVGLITLADLNAFFLKTTLWVDVASSLNIYRLLIISFTGFPSVREYYQFVHDPKCRRFGSQAWILVASLFVEASISFKVGRQMFKRTWQEYFPPLFLGLWISGGVIYLLIVLSIKPTCPTKLVPKSIVKTTNPK